MPLFIFLVEHGLVLQVKLVILLQKLVANGGENLLLLHGLLDDLFILSDFILEGLILPLSIAVLLADLAHVGDCPHNLVVD